jgi:hypothetical protein
MLIRSAKLSEQIMKTAKKPQKQPLRRKIIDAVISHLEREGKAPVSVHRLCKDLAITEKEFYDAFPSLASVEKSFWEEWIGSIISAIRKGKEWPAFTAKEQYLAFLYSFSAEAMNKRSLLEQRFGKLTLLCSPSSLDGLKRTFKDFADETIKRGMDNGEIACRGPLGNLYPEVLYIHWRTVLEFYLKDESQGFERTDAFIEKSVEFAFDLLHTQAFDSAADLIRFLLPQIARMGRE